MNLSELMNSHIPPVICAVLSVLFLVEMYKFVKRNDIPSWMRWLNALVARAAGDKEFLATQLEKVRAELAAKPARVPLREITFAQERRLRRFPRMMFFLGMVGTASAYIGLFWNREGLHWPVIFGCVLLALSGTMYIALIPLLRRYARAQLLNRQFLLQKVGDDAGQTETLRELMRYYPKTAGLNMEMADRLAAEGDIAAALGELAAAAENEPKNVDVAMMRVGMLLRKGEAQQAEEMLAVAEKLPRQALDPRKELYRAALAEKRGEKEKTREFLAKARETNAGVSDIMLEKDPALMELQAYAPEKKTE